MQRTAIVLRYWEELTEIKAAEAMGCSQGTVDPPSRGLQQRELSNHMNTDTALHRTRWRT